MPNTIPPPEEQKSERFEYLTEDGEATFDFNIIECISADGRTYYEIDIVQQPSYQGKEHQFDNHKTASPRGGEMACIGDYPSSTPTIEKAKYWAGMWAKFTWRYIKTGEHFPG